jgi:hypothetical protein
MSNWLSSARKTNKRRARNFSHESAQKRLDETIRPFHEQVENSLQVDGVEAIVFKKSVTGRPCTCKKTPVLDEIDQGGNQQGEGPDLVPQGSESDGITFDMGQDDVFGHASQSQVTNTHNASKKQQQAENREFEAADILASGSGGYDTVEEDGYVDAFEEGLFSGNVVNCGVCYSRGVTPPFEPVDHTMYVLTNYHMQSVQSYNVDFAQKPALITCLSDDGYVEFEINVPKYFKDIKYSVRDNLQLISGMFLYVNINGSFQKLTMAHLNAARGKSLKFYVVGESFTHVVVFFSHNSNPLMVNISQENETLDYTRESSIGQITVIGPERIGHMQNSDVIVIPKRNLVLKVTDAPRKSTAQKTIIEWEMTTRAVQSSESIKQLFSGYKVY